MSLRAMFFNLILLSFLGTTTGCSSGNAEVKGTVTLNGEPVSGAMITLIKEGEKPTTADGLSDANGNFTMQTGNQSGVPAGKYKVIVSKTESFDAKLSEEAKNDPTKAALEFHKLQKTETSKAATPPIMKGVPIGMMPPSSEVFVAPKQKHLLPEKYARVESTPFSFDIPSKEPLKLELIDDKTKKN